MGQKKFTPNNILHNNQDSKSFAVSFIGVAERACETGQPVLVDSACSRNVGSSIPGTKALQLSSI